ncbi:MAG: hypothetical protein WEB58_17305 [Planctomycetaceae bacterium]
MPKHNRSNSGGTTLHARPTQSMKHRKCFIISPLGKNGSKTRNHADKVLDKIISPVLHQFEFEPIRIDRDLKNPGGSIPAAIVNELRDSELCVAILTGLNPNVMFEVGVRQAWDLPIIHLADRSTELPFDVRSRDTVSYSYGVVARGSCEDVIEALARRVESVKHRLDTAVAGEILQVSEVFGKSMAILGKRHALDAVFDGKRDALQTLCDQLRQVEQIIELDYDKNKNGLKPLGEFLSQVTAISRDLRSKVYTFQCLASKQHQHNDSRKRCEPLLKRMQCLQKDFNRLAVHLENATSSETDFNLAIELIESIIQEAETVKSFCHIQTE